MTKLGEQLRELRKKKGLSQRDLTRATGIHQPTISDIEKGVMPLVSPHLAPIAKVLGVQVVNPLGDNHELVALQGTIIPVWPQSQVARIFSMDEKERDQASDVHHVSFMTRSARSFFTILEDESMQPEIRKGNLVAVDPEMAPEIGKIVMAARGDDSKAVIGRFASRGADEFGNPRFEIIPENRLYPTLHSDSDRLEILGVVCEAVNVFP